MKKLLALGFLSMFTASQAYAGFVSSVTGEDMAGIEVTVTYTDTTTSSATWVAGSAGSEAGGTPTTGFDWSLTEVGDTIGDVPPSGLTGVWTFETTADIVSIFINTSATDILFDTEFFDASMNGSGAGREFTYDDTVFAPVTASFSGLYMDELYTGLTISAASGFTLESGFEFMIDTDEVPAPAALSLLLLGLGGLVARRRKA